MKQKNFVVAKHNDLIQARMPNITLDQMRILNMILGCFNPLNPKMHFDFTVKEFMEIFSLDEKSAYKQAENAVNSLRRQVFVLQDDERVRDEVTIVTRKTYFKKEGRFHVQLHEELRPYIAELKSNYTKYFLENVTAFKSLHTLRLYEVAMLVSGKYNGDFTYDLDKLKYALGVYNKYKIYADFTKRVLAPAIDEINGKSDLLVAFEPVRVGRSYKKIRIIAHKKNEKPALKAITDPVFGDVIADPLQADYWESSNYAWQLVCEKYGVDYQYIFNALRNRKEKIIPKGKQHYYSLTDKYLSAVFVKIANVPQGIKYITELIKERRI